MDMKQGPSVREANTIEKPWLKLVKNNTLLLKEQNFNAVSKNTTISDPFGILNQPTCEESQFFCAECRKEFTSFKQFYLHRRQHAALTCPQSYKTTNNKFNYCPLCLDLIVVNKDWVIQKHNKKLFNYLYCKICETSPKSINKLKNHYELHHQNLNPFHYIFSQDNTGVGDFHCKICLKNFQNLKLLNDHEKTHLEIEKVKECNMCNQVFQSNYDLTFHRYTHAGEELFKCCKCDYIFFISKFLQDHKGSKHPKIDTSCICEYCGVTFTSSGGLSLHKKTHNKPNIQSRDLYSCDTCHLRFTKFCQLEEHKINTIHKTDDVLKCKKCSKTFCYQKLYDEHMFSHDPTMRKCIRCNEIVSGYIGTYLKHFDNKHQCKSCPAIFKDRLALKQHEKTHLTPLSSCEYCHKSLEDAAKYSEHCKFHRYVCLLCRKTFRNSSALMFHDFLVHASSKKYPCTKCSIRFYKKELLEEHLEIAHYTIENSLKQFKIEKIPNIKSVPVYMNTVGLPDHNLLENDLLPYACKYCELKFSNLESIKVHLIDIHISPFEAICNICNENFHLSTYLKKHKEHVHAIKPIKRYKCKVCCKRFTTRIHKEKHEQTTHYYCKLCNKVYFKFGYFRRHYKNVHYINKTPS